MSAYALKARYLFPIDGPPIPDGVLTLAGDRIVAVGENVSGNVPRDLGNVAVLPGLINAHAHLEFSDLPSPLGRPGMPFTDWLAAVVTWRRQQLAETDSVERRYRAAERGLEEVARTGTAAVGEIASPGWPEAAFQSSPVDTTVFLELLGLAPNALTPCWPVPLRTWPIQPHQRNGEPGLPRMRLTRSAWNCWPEPAR